MQCLPPLELLEFIQIVGFEIGLVTDSFIELVTSEKSFFWAKQADGMWCFVTGDKA